ncbi:MAG: caspase domain-containing protein [Flavobacteriaceae bacterium]
MSKRALVIGINHYQHFNSLSGCVNDAQNVKNVLELHANTDKDRNFEVELLVTEPDQGLSKNFIKDRIETLFQHKRDMSILYFSGHGYVENTGGYLITSECRRGDNGLSMNDILVMANASPAQNRIIILDCCHAGSFGQNTLHQNNVSVSEGVTILAASAADQYSIERGGAGVFTSLFIHAMEGGAASILGEITAGNIYSYIDKAMGETEQRPLFITNVRRYTPLRKIASQITLEQLRQITALFHEGPEQPFELDETFEPESGKAIPENVQKFEVLQKYNRVNLVVPVGASKPHMYHAAMEEKHCELTPQGKSYWVMVKNGVI